mgnify:CR=1 FL=1
MIVIRMMAGLGNQMFQYALYKSLLSSGKIVYIDDSWYRKFKAHNDLEIENIFNVSMQRADHQIANRLGYADYNLWQRFRQKYLPKSSFRSQNVYDAIVFDKSIEKIDDVYLSGYWQSEKYFIKIANQIRKDFAFPVLPNSSMHEEVMKSNTVSIHIRRGDYVNNSLHGDVCDLSYYYRAINYIRDHVSAPKFIIFSDDILWCRDNLKLNEAVFVTGNYGKKSYVDMQLMSMCKHNIIANSSFSWWGAWLNSNPNKMVVAPRIWFRDKTYGTGDIIPDSWFQL